MTVVTIDPKTARDFDDAISLKQLENGHWELGVHIADVSHFVPYRSELDNEAFQRGTSVYLPDRVIPMLPEIISNNLASLQPDRVRYCMTAMIEFTAEGVPVATELFRGAIKSVHRFNYEEIDDYLANDKPWKKKLAPEVFKIVRDMHTLAMILRKRRMDGGSINSGAAGNQDRSGRRWQSLRCPHGREHRKPSSHRRIHVGGQRSGCPTNGR